jgi:hypothetical protein
MVDPFRTEGHRERVTHLAALAVLVCFVCAVFFLWMRADVSDGNEVTAVVVRLGTYPDPLGTGDSPILTVRLADGSVRQVRASWQAVNGCQPGRAISILQRGTAVQVGLRGCYLDRRGR